jgi:GNAT superfamily N-acetyltransferase
MYIEKRWRHHQIGSLFFHEFLKNCKARGVSAIRVLASAKNKDAISFYKKHGFRDFDVIMRRKC